MNCKAFTALLISAFSAFGVDYYVATNGNNTTGDGSVGNPYLTLQRACNAIYTLNQSATVKRIFLRGGAYYNTAAELYRTRADNTTIQSYPGEQAIIYGGQPLTNWTDLGDGTWNAPLGTFPTFSVYSSVVNPYTSWQPRTLLANGVPVKWATYPETGKIHYTSQAGANLVYTNTMEATTNNEVNVDLSWSDWFDHVTAIDTGTKTLTVSTSVARGPNADASTSYLLRNGPEGMLSDNTYWWDKTNLVVHYRPPAGSDPNSMTIIVPTTTRMIYGSGNSANGVNNCVFSNLTFAVTTALKQGAADFSEGLSTGAITLSAPTNCVIDNCTFYCLGGAAISGGATTSQGIGNTVRNCIVHDTGAMGIFFTGRQNVVSNNLVYNCGLIGQAGCGIVSAIESTTCNNTVSNIMGCGINVRAYGKSNLVRDNWVQDCVLRLQDMGAIYGWGSTNATIYHNYVANIQGTNSADVSPWQWFKHGIYADAYTTNWIIASNIVFNCSRPFQNNETTRRISIINNVFYDPTLGLTNWHFFAGTNQNRVWQRNISMAQAKWNRNSVSGYNLNSQVQDWHSNIVYSANGDNSTNPTNALSVDPMFTSVASKNFTFQPVSLAPSLGIQPLSLVGIGYNAVIQTNPVSDCLPQVTNIVITP